MAELINFNKAKKARAKAAGKTQASENRVKFGQAKCDPAIAQFGT